MSKKILLICNESMNVVNFRSELIKFLISNNYSVDVLCADNERIEEIKQTGANDVHVVPFTHRDTNPFSLIKLKKAFVRIIKQVNPNIVFTFQAKPNIVGASAAYKCGVKNIVSMVEGLGNPFNPTNFKGKVLRIIVSRMYKKALRHNKLVIFLNEDDKKEFINRKISRDNNSLVIPGIGIDTNAITPCDIVTNDKKVVMLSRLTANKGIEDYCRIASLVRKTRPDILFELYGKEQDVSAKDLAKYIAPGDVLYYGYIKNPVEAIKNATIYISTSFYREGFPRTLLEAMALAKPIIATDTVGSKDAIKDGINGYLLRMHGIEAFAKKILGIIDNKKELERIGQSARKYCEDHYNSDKINSIILSALDNLDQ